MPTPTQTLAYLEAGLDQLENYLRSDILYWPLEGSASLPRLTIGGLLLGLKRLQGEPLTREQEARVNHLASRFEVIHSKWRSAWEDKCRQEAHARLNLWKNYLADFRQSPEVEAESYPEQVQMRVLLQLLAGDLPLPPEDARLLADLDTMVKSSWLPGVFIWEPGSMSVFREPEYWFLYGKLKS